MYAHVHYNWQLTRGVQADKILNQLPAGVRRDIQMFLLASIVGNFPIFANTPVNFITAIVEKFRAELLIANEYVFTADEIGKHLYIIHIGRVEVITAEGVVVGKLSDGARMCCSPSLRNGIEDVRLANRFHSQHEHRPQPPQPVFP